MKKFLFLWVVCSMLFLHTVCVEASSLGPYQRQSYPSDEEVVNIAIQKGILPQDLDIIDAQEQLKAGNSVIFWLLTPRQDKISAIDELKKMFETKENVLIRKSAIYYVNEMNGVLYHSIDNEDISTFKYKGIGTLFKTIAVMDGDFDNGQDRVELFKEWLGEDVLNIYRQDNPDKYQRLLEIRQETIEDLSKR